jgi:hypothetical protein
VDGAISTPSIVALLIRIVRCSIWEVVIRVPEATRAGRRLKPHAEPVVVAAQVAVAPAHDRLGYDLPLLCQDSHALPL